MANPPMGNFGISGKPSIQQEMLSSQSSQADQAKQLESQVSPMPEAPKPQRGGVDLKDHVGFFGAMMLLSALAARSTGAPMTAAMNNMTASLKGFQAGNAAIQEQQQAEMWRNFDVAMQQHKASLEKYKIGLDAMYKDTKNGPQKLYMQLLEDGYDPKLAAELSSPGTAAKLYDSMLKAQQHAHEQADKVKHWQEQERAKKTAQFDKEIFDLETKKSKATTPEQKASFDEQIRLVQMRKNNALGGAGVAPAAPADTGKPTPTEADIAYAKANSSDPDVVARFKAHFGVEPPK